MKIIQVADVLAADSLVVPDLHALLPNEDNYTAMLMQPRGDIQASSAGVGHHDRDSAHRQFKGFIALARDTQADLAITPEYSMLCFW